MDELDCSVQASYPAQDETISNRGVGGPSDICRLLTIGIFEVGSGNLKQRNLTWNPFTVSFQAFEVSLKRSSS